jgi:hypothetical protein
MNRLYGWNIKIHVDAASGAFIAPFLFPDLLWCALCPCMLSPVLPLNVTNLLSRPSSTTQGLHTDSASQYFAGTLQVAEKACVSARQLRVCEFVFGHLMNTLPACEQHPDMRVML